MVELSPGRYLIRFIIAILLTSLAYYLGVFTTENSLFFWQALIIGATVVIAGAIVEKMNAPMWLIIFIPFPIGMFLLYVFLNEALFTWFYTYLLTLFIYVALHMLASSLFRFHSLIPAWKLREGA